MQKKGLFSTGISETCENCLRKLIELTVRNATNDPSLQEKAINKALEIVNQLKGLPGMNPAHIANRFHPLIKTICKNEDPFAEIKKREIKISREITSQVPPPEDLSGLIIYSLLGNTIDFFRNPEELKTQIFKTQPITINEVRALEEKLNKEPISIVFLPDNAGEIFFDLPLLKRLSVIGHRVTYAVKEAPIQNDLCWNDVKELDIDWNSITVISTGAATVGLELERTSGYFQSLYKGADLIIGKGMGHFETLWTSKDPRIFLIFQAKCMPVAETIGVPINSGVACFVGTGGTKHGSTV